MTELTRDDYNFVSSVVWGKVERISAYGKDVPGHTVKFKVYRSYKGSSASFLELKTAGVSTCGLDLNEGEKWLLFIDKRNTVGLCGPNVRYTKRVDESPIMAEKRLKKFRRYIEKIKTYEKL